MTGMALVHCILGKFLGVALPLLSPRFLDVPTFHHQVPPRERSPAVEVGTVGKGCCPIFLPK